MTRYMTKMAVVAFVLGLVTGCGEVRFVETPTTTGPAVARNTALPGVTVTVREDTPTPVPTATAPEGTPTPAPASADTTVPAEGMPMVQEPGLSLAKSEQAFDARGTFQVALGDLDGDGDLDGVFANPKSHNSEVWLNDGAGLFVDTGQQLTQYGHGVGLGDWDGDGDLDAFIACHFFFESSKVYLNDGTGRFEATGQDLGDASISGADLNVVDLDGDGNLDVHVLYYAPEGVPDRVYLSAGEGAFADSGLLLDESVIAWGDVDGDGDADLFGKVHGEGYRVQLNDGRGQLSMGWTMADSQAIDGGIALADFDGDGDLDAAVANGSTSGSRYAAVVLWNDGSGQFTDSGQRLHETVGAELAAGDLDGDGDVDLFVSNIRAPNEVWLNDGSGRFADSGLRLEGELSTKPALGDLDRDGDLDVFVGSLAGRPEIWFNETAAPGSDGGEGAIAFVSTRDGNPEIYLMDEGSGTVTRLTEDPGYDDSPAISPDGRQVVFLTARHDPSPRFPDLKYEIYVVDIDGTNLRRLTETEAGEDHPAWSPDGTTILFDADYDGDGLYEIYTMGVDDPQATRLTFSQANDQFGDWSSDGTQIAFSSDRAGNWDVWVMDADGSDPRALTTGSDWELFPAWSPDGKEIAFNGLRPNSRNTDVYVMKADGSDVRQLTSVSGFDENPTWSPDGSRIAFQSARGGNFRVCVIRADGTDPRPLVESAGDDFWPSWGLVAPAGGATD